MTYFGGRTVCGVSRALDFFLERAESAVGHLERVAHLPDPRERPQLPWAVQGRHRLRIHPLGFDLVRVVRRSEYAILLVVSLAESRLTLPPVPPWVGTSPFRSGRDDLAGDGSDSLHEVLFKGGKI